MHGTSNVWRAKHFKWNAHEHCTKYICSKSEKTNNFIITFHYLRAQHSIIISVRFGCCSNQLRTTKCGFDRLFVPRLTSALKYAWYYCVCVFFCVLVFSTTRLLPVKKKGAATFFGMVFCSCWACKMLHKP